MISEAKTMQDIAKLDKNFKVETSIDKQDIKFYDCEESPFKIYGVFREGETFVRMPQKLAESVSEGVAGLNRMTAGGRIRFVTNSKYVALSVKFHSVHKMPHMALTGIAGFDMYTRDKNAIEDRYRGTFRPPFEVSDGFEGVIEFPDESEKTVTINMPLFSSVKKIYIGLSESSELSEAPEYRFNKPIVYYGSSITHGGCASKPGSAYQSIISRRFDCDYINLGYSGNAKGETEMADYIASFDNMWIFVYDYDHNAPNAEHLELTHERMFKIIRKAHPELPIIIMSKPRYYLPESDVKRRDVIKRTYENAVASGDKNVYFIDGPELMEPVGDNGTVDGVHPTDSGFFFMAQRLSEEILKII